MNQDHQATESTESTPPWVSAFLDAALDAIIISDDEGRILDFNRAAEQTFGYERAEVLGSLLSDTIIPTAFREPHRLGLKRFKETEIPKILRQRLELPSQRKDGSELMIELTVVKIDIPGPARFIGYLRDISEAKRAEEALRLTQFSIDRAGDSVFWIRPDSTISYANDQACRSLGYSQQELLNMSVLDFSPNFPREDWATHWNRTKEQQSFTFESVFCRQDSKLIPVQITVNYVEYAGGEYNCAFVRDISETKQFQETLKTALSAAKSANKAKTEFLAVISHEMRTPLNVVLGMTSELQAAQLESEVLEQIRDGDQSARDLLALINDVLDFSQVESGRLRLRSEVFDLSELWCSIVSRYEYRAKDAGLDFTHSIAAEVPKTVFGDAVRLKQVLNNLLDNAIKFTPDGSIRLECSVVEINDDEVELQVSIDDTGVGVSEANRDRIFRRFEQVEPADIRRFQGIGLGLAICSQIVQLMRGRIRVDESEIGGARFQFTVQLGLKEPGLFDHPRQPGVLNGEQLQQLAGRRVLVVEDDPASRRLVERMLSRSEVEVETVEGGLEALVTLERHPESRFGMIFMDLMMPDMNGLECTQRIRRLTNPTISEIPIVAMTARAMDGDREQCLAAGMNDYLTKPLDRQLMLSKMYELLIGPLMSADVPLPHADTHALDEAALRERCMDDDSFVIEILDLCTQVGDESIDQCRAAFQSRDMDQLAKISHRLRGSVVNIHAGAMTSATTELMTTCRNYNESSELSDGAFDDCGLLLVRVVDEWNRLLPAIRELRSRLA